MYPCKILELPSYLMKMLQVRCFGAVLPALLASLALEQGGCCYSNTAYIAFCSATTTVSQTTSYLRDWTSVAATLALAVDLAAVVLIKLPPGVTNASAWPVRATTASAAVAACTDRTIDLNLEEQIPSGLAPKIQPV